MKFEWVIAQSCVCQYSDTDWCEVLQPKTPAPWLSGGDSLLTYSLEVGFSLETETTNKTTERDQFFAPELSILSPKQRWSGGGGHPVPHRVWWQ